MTLAASLKKLLTMQKISYRIFPHKRASSLSQAAEFLNIPPGKILSAQILADEAGMILVVYPLSCKIDFNKLKLSTNRNLKVLAGIKVNRLFRDCDAGCWPPIGQTYGLEIIIDKSIYQQSQVFFSSGSSTSLLQVQAADYLYLNPRAKLLDFACPLDMADKPNHVEPLSKELESLSLPSLPPIALKILQLSIGGEHSAQELVDLVSQDPLIQQQILIYTQLPFIQKKVETPSDNVQHIVDHVLGFDMVSHIALGIAAGRAFTQRKAVNETKEFWRHAFYAATYAQRITHLVSEELHLDPAVSYLAGLFHNFGLLLFSQLFQPEYLLLKKWMHLNPKVSIALLEKRLLGMGQAFVIVRGGHAQLGEALLRHWHMPESICVIAKEHHSLTYKGEYSLYVKIIQITNQLLRQNGIGDGNMSGLSEQLLEPLGLTEQQILDCVKNIEPGLPGLDLMAHSLTSQ
jgi:HD-like signal output (HDOD) protein/prolyl-tRNA editing enzyme YbaK/EbsC (Cys-tRNA(Pro) deacylase)